MAWIWPGCATGPDLSVHGSGRAVYSQHHYVYLSWQTYRVHIYHAIHLVYSYLSILPSLHRTAEKNRAMFPPCTAHASNARGSSMRLVTLRYVPHRGSSVVNTPSYSHVPTDQRERNLEPLSPLVNSSLFPSKTPSAVSISAYPISIHGRSVGNMQGLPDPKEEGGGG